MVLLVIFGMTLLARLQVWTQPLWLILLFGPFLAVAVTHPSSFAAFTYFGGNSPSGSAFTLVGTGAGAGVTLSLIAQIGEQADYLRFMPGRTSWNAKGRRTAVLAAAPGGTLSPLVLNGDALAMCPGLLGDWDSVGKAFDGGAYLNRIGVSTRADRLEDLTAALARRQMFVTQWYGVGCSPTQSLPMRRYRMWRRWTPSYGPRSGPAGPVLTGMSPRCCISSRCKEPAQK